MHSFEFHGKFWTVQCKHPGEDEKHSVAHGQQELESHPYDQNGKKYI